MADKARRYTVSGIDDQGDVHSYYTDDAKFAQAMRHTMAEDAARKPTPKAGRDED